MSTQTERLYALLPAVHRIRDAELGSPLRGLLALIESELQVIENDIETLYDSWFIETAPEWVVPYIGALVGNTPLVETGRSRRADVARTMYYRRRKGTLPMLEELARDVTGWGAHAFEQMELLCWTQNVNHLRFNMAANRGALHPNAVDRVGTVNVRSRDVLDRIDGAFDETVHTVDVRRPPDGMIGPAGRRGKRASQSQGRYAPRTIAFHLWRLNSYPLLGSPARRADPPITYGWHFSPLGAVVPLFTDTSPERDPRRLAREIHVPGPIRPLAFHYDLEDYRARFLPLPVNERPADATWYGPNRSVHISADGIAITPDAIQCRDLSNWARPAAGRVAVDVRRGRIAFAAGEEPAKVVVRFAYGFSADMGGGPYDRRAALELATGDPRVRLAVSKAGVITTLQQAIAEWEALGKPAAVISIEDNCVYGGVLAVDLPASGRLAIVAAERCLPSVRLVGDWIVSAPADGGTLVLHGLLIEGALELDGAVSLNIDHSTIVPGRMLTEDGEPWFDDRDSIVVTATGTQMPTVLLDHAITGPLRLPDTAVLLTVRDSIVQSFPVAGTPRPAIAATDTNGFGPRTIIERSTIFGPVFVRELALASETIFVESVRTQRQQTGCVRFSYVPEGSVTPRRFRCQPDLALDGITGPAERARIRARLTPVFTSGRFSDPGYAQLRLSCAEEIRTGAENGAEMGAFCSLMQPQREANLRTRLEEYLPFGLDAALIYIT